ncbi:hypothetical protein HMPREF1586_00467 [Gardnerella vaginalis JCP8522]|nr:hypothetical protein HMPREF1586_00467 [Gardnerella vaginalis JCP8522]
MILAPTCIRLERANDVTLFVPHSTKKWYKLGKNLPHFVPFLT